MQTCLIELLRFLSHSANFLEDNCDGFHRNKERIWTLFVTTHKLLSVYQPELTLTNHRLKLVMVALCFSFNPVQASHCCDKICIMFHGTMDIIVSTIGYVTFHPDTTCSYQVKAIFVFLREIVNPSSEELLCHLLVVARVSQFFHKDIWGFDGDDVVETLLLIKKSTNHASPSTNVQHLSGWIYINNFALPNEFGNSCGFSEEIDTLAPCIILIRCLSIIKAFDAILGRVLVSPLENRMFCFFPEFSLIF